MDVPSRQRLWLIAATILVLLPLCASLSYNQSHSVLWFLRAGGASLLAVWLLAQLYHHRQSWPLWLRVLLVLGLAELLALFMGLRLVSFFFQGESFNARFLFHLNPDSLTDAGSYPLLIGVTSGFLVLAPVLLWFGAHRWPARPGARLQLPATVLALLLVEPDLAAWLQQATQNFDTRDDSLAGLQLEGTGLHPEAIERRLEGVSAGRNLVFVYLESLEKVYTEPAIFPGLTPFLTALKSDSLYFTDLRSSMGATWTVAGMMASQCGTPLLTPIGPRGNDMLQNGFLHEATCLGDLLRAAGYRQSFVGGASTRFAGKGTFLREHGYDEILGLDELQPLLPNPDYLNNWGLYDDSTLAFALDKFHELATDAQRPFNLTVLTVDTHHPAGTPSASCPRYAHIDNSILHAVHCTDWLLQRFVAGLQQHPAWDNTVLVLMSDHLAMRNIAQHLYPPDYGRELYLAIINAGTPQQVDLAATHMDLAPTLLPLLEVGHEQQFLAGDDLLAPATGGRVVDFDAPARIAAIRFINNELLTRHDRNVCSPGAPALSLQGDALQLAGKDTYLGLGGRAVPLTSLASDNGFVALLENDGAVQASMLVARHNLPFFLHQTGDLGHLVLGSAAMLAPLVPEQPVLPGLAVVAGAARGGHQLLLQGAGFDGFELELDCRLLPLMTTAAPQSPPPEQSAAAALARLCPAPPEQSGVTWDEASDRIAAARVAVANQWYRAALQGDGKGHYRIAELELLGPVPATPPGDYCHAYFGRSQALIPYLQADGKAYAMQLEQVPGSTDRFQLQDLYER